MRSGCFKHIDISEECLKRQLRNFYKNEGDKMVKKSLLLALNLLLMTSLVSMPYFMSSVLASAWNFQVVLLSGNVNCTMTSPSSFVSNDG